jgi:hypothetical protein
MRDGMSKIPGLSEVEVQIEQMSADSTCRFDGPSAAQQRFLSLVVGGDLAVRHQNGDVNSSRNINP